MRLLGERWANPNQHSPNGAEREWEMENLIEVANTYAITNDAASWHVCALANGVFILSRVARRGDYIAGHALGTLQDEPGGRYRVYSDLATARDDLARLHDMDATIDRGDLPQMIAYPEYGLEGNT